MSECISGVEKMGGKIKIHSDNILILINMMPFVALCMQKIIAGLLNN